METFSVARISAKLEPSTDSKRFPRKIDKYRYTAALNRYKSLLPIDYEVSNSILKWIDRHTHDLHITRIAPYHHTKGKPPGSYSGFCPCCLAFSLWFFSVAEEKYPLGMWSERYASVLNENDNFWGGVLPITSPTYLQTREQNETLVTPDDFNCWRYRRALLVAFVHILHVILALDPNECAFTQLRSGFWAQGTNRQIARNTTLRKYMVVKQANILTYYYPDEDPLSEQPIYSSLDKRSVSCWQFYNYPYLRDFLRKGSAVISISHKGLSREKFLELHGMVRSLLPNPVSARFKEYNYYRKLLLEDTNYGRYELFGES
ncbi:MAG: hypothetical protein VYA99_10185 [Pseudomonadota bacterium]|nr:hypothetical protein [Pseudomonadota bacterium]